MRPPWSETIPWLMLIPSPVPSPTALVVKNGSKIRGRTSAASRAVIRHLHDHLVARPPGGDFNATALPGARLDRLHCIHDNVHDDLINLGLLARDPWQVREVLFDRDSTSLQSASDQLQAARDGLVDVHPVVLGMVEPGESAEVLNDVGYTFDPLPRTLRIASRLSLT